MQQCPKCGSGAPDGATECSICFAPLGQTAAAPAPLPQPVAPSVTPPTPPAASHHPAAGAPPVSPLGIAVPKEEDYMPSVGIPGVDNIPKDAPSPYGAPAPLAPSPYAPPGIAEPQRIGLTGDVI